MKYRGQIDEHPSIEDAFTVDVWENRDGILRLVVAMDFKLSSRNLNFERAVAFLRDELKAALRGEGSEG